MSVLFWLLNTLCLLTSNLCGLSYVNVISVELLGTLTVVHNLNPVPDYFFEETGCKLQPTLYTA